MYTKFTKIIVRPSGITYCDINRRFALEYISNKDAYIISGSNLPFE